MMTTARAFRPASNVTRAHQLVCRSSRATPPLQAFRQKVKHSNQVFMPQRFNSTTSEVAEKASTTAKSGASGVRKFILCTSLALVLTGGYFYATDTRAGVHRYVIVPVLRWAFDAEEAHHMGITALRTAYSLGVHPRERWDPADKGELSVEVFGQTLSSPLAISGGLDKNADVPSALLALGPSIVEIGGITPEPQEGNPKPRVFRIPSQEAMINRYGLPTIGADHMAIRLSQRVREFARAAGFGYGAEAERRVLNGEAGVPAGSLVPGKMLAIQISKQKTTPEGDIEAVKRDYVYSVDRVGKYADIITVNVSSPNTPGLRSLQETGPLTDLLGAVVEATNKIERKTKLPVMVKVSPDEDSDEQIAGICEAVWASGVDGVIVANTTKSRPGPVPKGYRLTAEEDDVLRNETGGYSGPQLFDKTLSLVKRYRKLLEYRPSARRAIGDESAQEPESEDNSPSADELPSTDTAVPVSSPLASSASSVTDDKPKVIFASGGITNGQQALEVLDAGASVAMVYTTLVFKGSGAITRMKQEMRAEIQKKNGEK